MSKALEAAWEACRLKRESGEALERLDPLEKSRRKPESLRLAITAKCFDCVGGHSADSGFRRAVRECPSTGCPLYAVRPWQRPIELGGER